MNEVEAVKAAIKLASCPGREGPFGGYDYGHNEAFYGPAPEDGRYVIRDFRDRKSPDWGKWLHQTDNREEHEAMFVKMTDDHIAQAAIAALDAARGDQVARVVEWLRRENGLCDCHARCETECGCGAWDDWKTKPLLQIADAIERGEPFNG